MKAGTNHPGIYIALMMLAAQLVPGQAHSVSSAPESHIIAPPAGHQIFENQKLVYSVQWHMLNAGTTTIILRRSDSSEHLTSTADSQGLVNRIFPVHDIFRAEFDPRTFCTERIAKHSEEGSRRLDRKIAFDYARAKSQVDDTDLKTGKKKHAEFDIPTCVTDVVSGFFYAGSLPLAPGYTHLFPVNDGGKTTDVRMLVEAREPVRVAGGSFATLRVKAAPVNGPLKGSLWVWVSDDARRLPVKMRSKLGFATLNFELQRLEPEAGAK
jgi:Protein of unknown function (DUF3108)